MLQNYLRDYPDSVVAINLKACTTFQLYQGKLAEEEFKKLEK
jgi:intraflagellar transport protein 56